MRGRSDLLLRRFYRIWTSKEAIVKATGDGLSMPLDGFDVSADPLSPPRMLRTTDNIGSLKHWVLYGLDPGKNYAGVLATSRSGLAIRGWSLELGRIA